MKHIKEEFDQLSFKDFLMFMLSIFCLLAGTVAIFLSLYIPPLGKVHNSVLTYFGMCSVFSGSLLGIRTKYDSELLKFQQTIRNSLPSLTSAKIEDNDNKKETNIEKDE